MDLMNIRHKSILASQPHLATASGGTLVIDVGSPKIDSLSVEFNMEQSGSGTPSPSNIRPIVGWSEIPVSIGSQTFTASLGGTYYGGTVDLVSGVLTVTHGLWTYSSESSVVTYSTKNEFRIIWLDFGSGYAPYSSTNYAVFGDQYTTGVNVLNYTNPAVYSVSAASSSPSRVFLKVRATDLPTDNIAGARAFMNSTKPSFWTPLATAQTVQLTGQAINAMLGQQTVTSPAGDLTIGYWAHDDTVTVRSYSGIPVFIDNAYLAGAGTLGAYGTNRDWFIAGPFDTGTEAGKSITYTRSGVFPNGQTAVWRTYNDQTGGAYDYWAISDSSGSTPITVTAAGRYVYASVKKSEASTAFMYQGSGSNVTYLYKGKNV